MKRNRVPRTTSRIYRREVICAGNPALALVQAVRELPSAGGQVWTIGLHHDDGCPALAGEGLTGCTCEIVQLEARRAA